MGNFSKAILIASVALCLHLPAFSQNISLKISDITVKDAIEQLKEKTGYAFVFSSADVDTNKRVSIMANVAGGMTQVGQEGRFIRGVRVAGQVENRQGGRVHCVLRKRGNKLWVDSGSGFGHNSSAW